MVAPSGSLSAAFASIGSDTISTRSSSRPIAVARILRLSGKPACPTTVPAAMPDANASGVRSIPSDALTRGPNTLTSTIRRARSRSTSQARPDSVSGQRSSTKPGLAPVATMGTWCASASAMIRSAGVGIAGRMKARSSAVHRIGVRVAAIASSRGTTSTRRVAVATTATSGRVVAEGPRQVRRAMQVRRRARDRLRCRLPVPTGGLDDDPHDLQPWAGECQLEDCAVRRAEPDEHGADGTIAHRA